MEAVATKAIADDARAAREARWSTRRCEFFDELDAAGRWRRKALRGDRAPPRRRARGGDLVVVDAVRRSSRWRAHLGIEHVHLHAPATSPTDASTARTCGRPATAPGKVHWAEAFAREHDVDLGAELLLHRQLHATCRCSSASAMARVVNPDTRLQAPRASGLAGTSTSGRGGSAHADSGGGGADRAGARRGSRARRRDVGGDLRRGGDVARADHRQGAAGGRRASTVARGGVRARRSRRRASIARGRATAARSSKGEIVAVVEGRTRGAAGGRADGAQLPAAAVGRGDADAALRRRGRGHARADRRHAQDDAGLARARQGGGARRRRRATIAPIWRRACSSRTTTSPRAAACKRGGRAGARAGAALAARRGRGDPARRRSTRRSPPAPRSCCSTTSIRPKVARRGGADRGARARRGVGRRSPSRRCARSPRRGRTRSPSVR